MPDFCTCSHCGADLRGPAVADEHLQHYGGDRVCRYGCGWPTHYSRLVGVYNANTDRTESWMCPDCEHEEKRDDPQYR